MNRRKMVISFGRISYSQRSELRQHGLAHCGHRRLSPNVKRGSIRIRTSSRHFIPTMGFWLRKVRGSSSIRLVKPLQQRTIPYRAEWSNSQPPEVDWVINMTYREWRVSKLAVDTWQSIFLRRVYSPQSGLKNGGASATPKTGRNLMTKRERLLFSLVRLIGLDWATRR